MCKGDCLLWGRFFQNAPISHKEILLSLSTVLIKARFLHEDGWIFYFFFDCTDFYKIEAILMGIKKMSPQGKKFQVFVTLWGDVAFHICTSLKASLTMWSPTAGAMK